MNSSLGKVMVTGITFGVFMAEALIHYNMGAAEVEDEHGNKQGFRPRLPPAKELAKIAAVTGTFSIISGLLISALEKKVGTSSNI